MNKLLLSTAIALSLCPFEGKGEELYVRAGQSLSAAIRQAREVRRLHQVSDNDTLFITLEDGRYLLSEPLLLRPEDSGTEAGPTVIRAAHPGKAIIDGGVALQGWRRPAREELKGIPAKAQDQIWVCPAPVVNGRIVETRQLWMGNLRLPQASLVPEGTLLPLKGFDKEKRTITVADTILPAYVSASLASGLNKGWMMVHQRWATALLRIKAVSNANGAITFTFLDPESRREFEHPWPQPVIADTLDDGRVVTSSFNLYGNKACLDQPGEWFQSYPDGLIYYVSGDKGGACPEQPVVVPVLETLVQVDGCLERPVHDILFRGLSFEHTSWTTPNREGWVTLQAGFPIIDAYKLQVPGLPEKTSLENQAWIGRPESAIVLKGVQRVSFGQCTFRQLGACGVDYVEAAAHCHIIGCRFEDIGATAILSGHFPSGGFETHVPFRPNVPDDLCHDLLIARNEVHHVGQEDWGACAINAGYVFNTTIADNEVSDCKWSGICLGWGWTSRNSGMKNNHLLRNHVWDFGMQMHDCGALYTLSYQPNSIIVGNKIGAMGKAPYATNNRAFYIYLDEATDGFTISDNEMPSPLIGTNQPGQHIQSDIKLP